MAESLAPESVASVAQKKLESKAYQKAIVGCIPKCVTADRLTWSRIVFMPAVGTYFYFCTETAWLTILGCGLAGVTDGLDGMVARVRDEQSLHGAHLDAQADKVSVLSLAFPMLILAIHQVTGLESTGYYMIALLSVLSLTIIGETIAIGIRQKRYARAKRGLSIDHDVQATKLSKAKTVMEFVGAGLLIISFSRGNLDNYTTRIATALLAIGGTAGMMGYIWDRWFHNMWDRWLQRH